MKLQDLFQIPESEVGRTISKEIAATNVSSLVFDTRKLQAGCVFVAIRGGKHDGHMFLSEAATQGAAGLVVEDANLVPPGFRGYVAVVASTRLALARLAMRWYDSPSSKLFTVGVTGTNGKTTTTHMIESVLNRGGWPTGVVGTIDHHLGTTVWPSDMTTPDPIAFQSRLKDFADHGAKAVALEVSSHALDQARVDGVEFDVGVFTNLTRDHLDYHGTMEAYFAAKLRFFTELLRESSKKSRFAILNVDDAHVARAAGQLRGLNNAKALQVWSFGAKTLSPTSRNLDFEYEILRQGFDGVDFRLRTPGGTKVLTLAMAGLHNVQNAVSAYATGMAAGFDEATVARAVEEIRGVNGRLEHIPNAGGLHVFVDYAHTDDALVAILKLLGQIRSDSKASHARIITVFGCGGDRDRGKRPLMMRAALDGSNQVIVTSDNPRTEDPELILDDAMAVVRSEEISKVERMVDRRAAIRRAIEIAKPGDVVLIAGKGHEATQTIGTVKIPFSDAKIAKETLEEAHG